MTDNTNSKFFITEPVPDGYAYYDVRVKEGPRDDSGNPRLNFSLVSIYKGMEGAEKVAQIILSRLREKE